MRANLFVPPDAPSGNLDAAAVATVANGQLFPAGDLDGDGIPDLTWYDYATDDYVGLVYGPIHDGDYAIADLVDRAWATWVQPSPVGDVNGDGLGDLAVSIETEADHDNLVERRVYLLAGTAPSGAVEDAAWLTVASDECGEIRVNEDATSWGCDVWLAPVQAGDLDGDGAAELVLQGVYASGETDDSQAAVIFDASSGTLELGAATPGVVWLVLDLFLFSAADENSGAAATRYLYGFRGPIE